MSGAVPAGSCDPHAVYSERLATRAAEAASRGRVARRLAYVRLVLFLGFGIFLVAALFGDSLSAGWALVPLALFLLVVVWHDRVLRASTAAGRAVRYHERAIARLEGRWAGTGNAGQGFLDPSHPYAADLDIFGRGSLFELLCTARTAAGTATLARWLTVPAAPEDVRRRQAAVRELAPGIDLREALAVAGEDAAAGVDPEDLLLWAESPPVLTARWPPWVAAGLAAANLVTLGLWLAVPALAPLWVASLGASGVFTAAFHRRARRVLAAIERPERELELLASVLHCLEQARFTSPLLAGLRQALDIRGVAPSRRIARLARLVHTSQSRSNMIFAPLSGLLLAGTQLAFAIERWRAGSGGAVRRWIEAAGEIEALCALAGHAFEHPRDPFPEIVEEGPRLSGRALGHPLIPEPVCVPNDVELGGDVRLWLVSGSNMSGKSTLLRTVGVNCVLALAGAPVRGEALRLSPLAVGASMRVLDSLQEGTSHFYAEITRLRRLVDLGRGPAPLLFLLDELFHGTNSHDRRVGAEALLRGLLGEGGVGLVTTHDLALAAVADGLGPRAVNVHFEDHLENGRVCFDYRLRPGVVRKSNALALMRAVGLDV